MPDPALEALRPVAAAGAFAFGAIVGSFLNVVAHRLPLGISLVRPRSRCPACRTPVRAVDNLPVLSWVLLGGRCRGCKGRISPRYAVVELLSGLLALGAWHVLVSAPGMLLEPRAWLHLAVVFVVTSALLAASLIDLDLFVLPDEITIPGMWAGPACAAVVPELVLGAARRPLPWLPAALPLPLQAALVSGLGVAVGAGVIWGLGAVGTRVFGKEAMGFGDVKFLGMIGGFVGPAAVLLALVVAAFLGAVVGLVQRVRKGSREIPFGPYLAVGGYVEMLFGLAALDWYLERVAALGGR